MQAKIIGIFSVSLCLLLLIHTSDAITRDDVMTRSQSWIDEGVMYSQTSSHRNQYGTYRKDCSGYVSMAWNMDMSYNTRTLLDYMSDIEADDLKPGDALFKPGHIALFVRWAAAGSPVVREEYSTGNPATERPWRNSYFRTFTPKRYVNIQD